jgi:hypothetical protein
VGQEVERLSLKDWQALEWSLLELQVLGKAG